MAASWEHQLLAAIVRDRQTGSMRLREAQDAGVRPEYFGSAEARLVWNWVIQYHNRLHNYGHVPSEQTLKETFRNLDLPVPVENFNDLCDKIIRQHIARSTESAWEKYISVIRGGGDPKLELAVFTNTLATLQEQARPNGDVDFKKAAMRECAKHFVDVENNHGITGLPWPWEQLNAATQGMQAGDFFLVWALPKSMKTWFGLVVAAFLFSRGYRVLVYSKEMRWEQTRDRIACILARVDYGDYKRGRMSESDKEAFLLALEMFSTESHPGQLMFTQADRLDGGPGGPAEIRGRVQQYRPDFVLLDSSYMLEIPSNSGNTLEWKNVGAVMASLKQVAKSTGVRMMAISQENERAAIKYSGKSRGTASMAFSTNIAADCDLGIRLVYHKKLRQLSLHMPIARETMSEGFSINAVACTNFDYVGDHLWEVGDDVEDAESGDNAPQPTAANPAASAAVLAHVPVAGDILTSRFSHLLNGTVSTPAAAEEPPEPPFELPYDGLGDDEPLE